MDLGIQNRYAVSSMFRVFRVFRVSSLGSVSMVTAFRTQKSVMQDCQGVSFATGLQDGKIQFASFGGEDNRQCVEVSEKSEFGRHADLLVLWVCGFLFGAKDAVNDFLGGIVPIVKSRLKQFQGWYNQEEVDNVLTDIWMKMTGNSPRGGAAFDPQKGELSTWIGSQILGYTTKNSRSRKLAKKLLGLSVIVDDDIELSSIGDKGLFGLTYEPADNDTVQTKWTRMVRMDNPTFDRVASLENSRSLEKVLAKLPDDNRQCLELYFVDEWTLQDIANKMEMSRMGVQKKLLRTINRLRQHYGIEGAVLSLGGKKRMVKMLDLDTEVQ